MWWTFTNSSFSIVLNSHFTHPKEGSEQLLRLSESESYTFRATWCFRCAPVSIFAWSTVRNSQITLKSLALNRTFKVKSKKNYGHCLCIWLSQLLLSLAFLSLGSSFSSGQAWSGHPFMIRNVDAIPESTGVNARETFWWHLHTGFQKVSINPQGQNCQLWIISNDNSAQFFSLFFSNL